MHTSAALWFFIATLSVWRVTHLLHAEDGPWDALLRLRRLAGHRAAGLFGCFYCLSLWVSVPFSALLATSWTEGVFLWLGLSGGAILAHRATEPRAPPAAAWSEAPSEAASQADEIVHLRSR